MTIFKFTIQSWLVFTHAHDEIITENSKQKCLMTGKLCECYVGEMMTYFAIGISIDIGNPGPELLGIESKPNCVNGYVNISQG